MENKNNKSLFWYGFWANVKILFGGISSIIGLINLFAYFGTNEGIYLFVALVFGIGGLILYFKGKSQRFDYKRQSGTIIHKGDW